MGEGSVSIVLHFLLILTMKKMIRTGLERIEMDCSDSEKEIETIRTDLEMIGMDCSGSEKEIELIRIDLEMIETIRIDLERIEMDCSGFEKEIGSVVTPHSIPRPLLLQPLRMRLPRCSAEMIGSRPTTRRALEEAGAALPEVVVAEVWPPRPSRTSPWKEVPAPAPAWALGPPSVCILLRAVGRRRRWAGAGEARRTAGLLRQARGRPSGILGRRRAGRAGAAR